MARADRPSLAAGLALLALGVVLLLDSAGALELSFALLAPIVLAAMGATLLASGLSRDS
ncbi:MAG TPA: hypothetical protein VEQ61_00440 [Thermoleophilaceae bacterium]|nr:hypothetical protein [Thermoleophilaceae bacterium]